MKRICYLLFGLIFSINVVFANDIKKISMDIHVLQNGDAIVTEVWDAKLTDGTEGYKQYYNLGNSTIKDFNVYFNNKQFEILDNWNINASFEDKKYKAGLNYVDEGTELCFGISEYGNNSYKFTYTITNFVSTLNDADMVYWTLIPSGLSDKPEYAYIKIYSDFAYDKDLPVWGYGNYGGYAYVYDGYIEMSNENGLDSDEYMTILIKYPKGTFNTSSVLDNDFDYYLDMAKEGSESYSEPKPNILIRILSVVMDLIIPISAVALATYAIKNSTDFGTKKIHHNLKRKDLKEAPYFRDIPCNKDINEAYYVSGEYNLIKNKTDYLGAILLKWLKDKNIENTTVTSKILKKETRAIKLLNKDNMNSFESELFDMMMESSGDGILESNEFTKWCQKHYDKILKWFNKVIDNKTDELVSSGKIIKNKSKYNATPSLDEEAMRLAGLKNFLNEFSNIKDRESIEVMLWEYYLMYAQIFGIAKKVAKEFKDLYPDIINDEYYNDIIFIHTISTNGVNAASTAKSRAESYNAGGGGFSAGGGGGGSFGGGGGGGFR